MAAYEFSKLVKNMPASEFVPDAQYMLAESYFQLSPNFTLDQKYTKKESPSIVENLKLEQLLETHDINVAAFNEAMQNIKEQEARQLLMAKLTEAGSQSNSH